MQTTYGLFAYTSQGCFMI